MDILYFFFKFLLISFESSAWFVIEGLVGASLIGICYVKLFEVSVYIKDSEEYPDRVGFIQEINKYINKKEVYLCVEK